MINSKQRLIRRLRQIGLFAMLISDAILLAAWLASAYQARVTSTKKTALPGAGACTLPPGRS
jgi:hypothetical protein